MISVAVLSREAPEPLRNCLASLRASADTLGWGPDAVEWILIDDNSESAHGIGQICLDFRASLPPSAKVNILRFREHRHYAFGVACALSLARGSAVLFFSHDMIVPPACIKTMLEAAATEDAVGIIRPTSQHMDWAEVLQVRAPAPCRSLSDISDFAEMVRRYWGQQAVEQVALIGDAMLVPRATLDRIGVFDTRFFGFLADIDYGLRAARAGLRIVCPRGAWLHHEGGGFRLGVAATQGDEAYKGTGRDVGRQLVAAYELFRQKWQGGLPERFAELRWNHLKELRTMQSDPRELHQPPIPVDPAVCEVL